MTEPDGTNPSPAEIQAPVPEDLGFPMPAPARPSWSRALVVGALVLVVLGGAFAWGLIPRLRARTDLAREAEARRGAVARIEVVGPKVISSEQTLALPGSVRPLEQTVIYPRVAGYVRSWSVDLGDRVEEGQVLALIDTPELDQELAVARAELNEAAAGRGQSSATLAHSKRDATRYGALADAGVASQEQLDEKQSKAEVDKAAVGVANATIEAKRANVSRLEELKSFAKVTAPFGGTITERTIERGALVTGTSTPLYRIQATDPLRVLIAVPQSLASSVSTGAKANVTFREFPGETFEGVVSRSSHALDPATRTMTTEIRVPNKQAKIMAGMAAKVALSLPAPHRVFEIPGTAVLTGAAGTQVAIVDGEDKLRFIPIVIERDTGATILVSQGLDGSERVVKNATGALVEGAAVEATESGPQ